MGAGWPGAGTAGFASAAGAQAVCPQGEATLCPAATPFQTPTPFAGLYSEPHKTADIQWVLTLKKKNHQFLSFTPHFPCVAIIPSFQVAIMCFQIFLAPRPLSAEGRRWATFTFLPSPPPRPRCRRLAGTHCADTSCPPEPPKPLTEAGTSS